VFAIKGVMNVTNCIWNLSGGYYYAHFSVDGGIFICYDLVICSLKVIGIDLIYCANNGVVDSCTKLHILEVESTDKPVIQLSVGMSTFRDSVLFIF
jgi:hypothetical protein